MHIDCPINLVIKMCTNENNQKFSNNKQSDFSIDHILNRAGELCKKIDIYDQCPNVQEQEQQEYNENLPCFDWLHYTRYRPPRLPRTNRVGPIKRTPGRLPRIPFSVSQLNTLEEAYKISTYLSSEDANKLATELELTSIRVKIWFQNRRARERREKKDNITSINNPNNCL